MTGSGRRVETGTEKIIRVRLERRRFEFITWNEGTAAEGISLVADIAGTDGIVVGDPTFGIEPTEAGTGISTLLLDTGSALTTLRAHQTLGPAVGRRADHSWLTGADTHSVAFSELTGGTAGVGVTRVRGLRDDWTEREESALSDGISCVAHQAGAHRLVPVGVAHGVDATDPGAGVDALVVDAGPVGGTVGVEDTLGSTGEVRVSEVARDASTGSGSGPGPALSVGATRCRVTGINDLC